MKHWIATKSALIYLLFSHNFYVADAQTLVSGYGVDNIQIGCTDANEIVSKYGKPNKIVNFNIFQKYEYEDLGLEFTVDTTKQNKLSSIITLPKFKGKTSDGISLGARRKEVFKIHGYPNDNKEIYWIYNGITFFFSEIKDKQLKLSTVEKIAISPKYRLTKDNPSGFEFLPIECEKKAK